MLAGREAVGRGQFRGNAKGDRHAIGRLATQIGDFEAVERHGQMHLKYSNGSAHAAQA